MAQFTVTGKVTDKSTNATLSELKVVAVDAENPNGQKLGEAETDANGDYTISFVSQSDEIIQLEYINFADA